MESTELNGDLGQDLAFKGVMRREKSSSVRLDVGPRPYSSYYNSRYGKTEMEVEMRGLSMYLHKHRYQPRGSKFPIIKVNKALIFITRREIPYRRREVLRSSKSA